MAQEEINKSRSSVVLVLVIIMVLSVAGNIFLVFNNQKLQKDLQFAVSTLRDKENSIRITNFTRMLVRDVLSADKEVNFETRLQLENAVRELNDPEILAQWKKFTESSAEDQAQTEVKILLRMLLDKALK